MEQLLIKLAELAPVVAVLAYFLIYFKAELKAKNDEIKELNTHLRETQVQTITAITKMTDVVDNLTKLIESKL